MSEDDIAVGERLLKEDFIIKNPVCVEVDETIRARVGCMVYL